jgi:hypothetical protein
VNVSRADVRVSEVESEVGCIAALKEVCDEYEVVVAIHWPPAKEKLGVGVLNDPAEC